MTAASVAVLAVSGCSRSDSREPTLDEARHDGLYELEVALPMCRRPGVEAPLWLSTAVPATFLVDITG